MIHGRAYHNIWHMIKVNDQPEKIKKKMEVKWWVWFSCETYKLILRTGPKEEFQKCFGQD